MSRGELKDYVLLCSTEDKKNTLHGLGLRKSDTGSLTIEVSVTKKSSFTPQGGLVITDSRSEQRVILVEPELSYVRADSTSLRPFSDTNDVKDAISDLLVFAVKHTLHTYHGFCMVHVHDLRPAFVFVSPSGQYTALTTTTTVSRMPATIHVNYLQPALAERSFWRATCFEPLKFRPNIEPWARPVDVAALSVVVLITVLTFNALNGEIEEPDEKEKEYEEAMRAVPSPFSPRF